jgi:hypothetical protein
LTRHNVIPASYQVRGKLQRESRLRPCVAREPETYKTAFLFSQETLLPAGRQGIPGQARNDQARNERLYNYGLISNCHLPIT